VASHPGGTRGCGTSCTNTVLTPEKLLHGSTLSKGEPRTLSPVRGEGREEEVVSNTSVEVSPHHHHLYNVEAKCQFCRETFTNKKTMNEHIRKEHSKFPCDDCEFIGEWDGSLDWPEHLSGCFPWT
jgi:hypothetical protein